MAACSCFKSWGKCKPQHALSEQQGKKKMLTFIDNKFTLVDNSEIHVDPSCVCSDGGRKPQRQDKPTQTGGEPASIWEGAGPRFKPTNSEDAAVTAEPAQHPRQYAYSPSVSPVCERVGGTVSRCRRQTCQFTKWPLLACPWPSFKWTHVRGR